MMIPRDREEERQRRIQYYGHGKEADENVAAVSVTNPAPAPAPASGGAGNAVVSNTGTEPAPAPASGGAGSGGAVSVTNPAPAPASASGAAPAPEPASGGAGGDQAAATATATTEAEATAAATASANAAASEEGPATSASLFGTSSSSDPNEAPTASLVQGGPTGQVTNEVAAAAGEDSPEQTAEEEHGKEADENDAVVSNTGEEQAEEEPAEEVPQTAPQPGTSYSLYSDPDRFSMENVHDSTHYLTHKLEGRLWLDDNGDGERGDGEYGTGVGGVDVQLVDCATDELVPGIFSFSQPILLQKGASEVKLSEDESAGLYTFKIDDIQAGRYYLMYQAPEGYRVSGNTLPLERGSDPSQYLSCIPNGGEGDYFVKQEQANGDPDIGGYCARSVGCMEVGIMNPREKSDFAEYPKLVVVESESTGETLDYTKHEGNLVALPSKDFLDVGLAPEIWPLATYQNALAEITLIFSTSDGLEAAVPDDFEGSEVQKGLEESLTEFFGESIESSFTVQDVDMLGGTILAQAPTSRMLRGISRWLQQAGEASAQVTYIVTTRGSYRPPPYQQLGGLVEDSINRDPKGFVKTLKDKEESLPEVFMNVEGARARHLTAKVAKINVAQVPYSSEEKSGMESWASVTAIILAALIVILMGVFLYRRAFARRARKKTDVIGDEVASMSTSAIKKELDARGVSTEEYLEKNELVEALKRVRKQGKKPRIRSVLKSSHSSSATSSNSSGKKGNSQVRYQNR